MELNNIITKIKITKKYTNPAILKLERQVQIIATQILYSFTRSIDQAIHIKILMISDKMLVL